MRTHGILGFLSMALLMEAMSGCSRKIDSPGPKYGTAPAVETTREYSFAVHPLYNPAMLMQAYHPLIDYLNASIKDARLALEASRDYGAFEEKYREGKPDFLLPNPWQTLQAIEAGYHVIAMAGEAADFKGIFIVRRDGGIRRPIDLKGKAISYPASTALAACIMPQYFLYRNGIDVNRDIENRFVGSQESSIMNVYLGITAAGATWPPPWRVFMASHPKEAAALEVAWETEPLVNNSVMARDNVPAGLEARIRELLTGLHETEAGKAILAGMETARFIRADDGDYEIARRYISRFERDVRKVQ